ncbi:MULTISPECIES: amino acid aminotransferase [unclassified Pseudomonas]|uniref:amino acid aminotransferase n=1 Tax=unclassified Pseudomonas TaxID=196821 RepID=UPI000BDA17A0|nr:MULTISPECIES: amino acid aminotransferase [unclassified Pseudomonas]PVZ11295.1 aromatic-amino-acid transaminase [Pseudomonas sp. URIL14HWK12:I12]PVZ22293.1 aromatic-amino-acid transaminase [Pseudomonas sp. URIL14HWK12:I10]PVZ31583.1 aromatic-amino-acid transaminase [Pseudomonas sp. URIL14HWK12:I11]SNZ16580.1 aromatic-amino-acid transaminase [Pseudomonas sp. URIL14HWK12:I9]
MFEHLPLYAGDPILGLMGEFAEDPRPNKVNLGVGIYYDEAGLIPLLPSVREAEDALVAEHTPRTYLPQEGSAAYRKVVAELLFAGSVLPTHGVAVIQTVGGSGALKVGADLLKSAWPDSAVWVSDPTWDNHLGIFQGAGFEVKRYPYFHPQTRRFDFEGALAAFQALPAKAIVLLHPCCHNPTGVQPTREQWLPLLDALQARDAIAFLDIAYQGFGDGLDDDAWLVRECARRGMQFLVSSSFSKTFSLYGERVGALSLHTVKADVDRVFGQMKLNVRRNYSSPPMFGATLVAKVLGDARLNAQWQGELAEMRERITAMRAALVEGLKARLPGRDFDFLAHQQGMFAYTGLSAEQVRRLKATHGVYAVETGRICIAGLNASNLSQVIEAFAEVMG